MIKTIYKVLKINIYKRKMQFFSLIIMKNFKLIILEKIKVN